MNIDDMGEFMDFYDYSLINQNIVKKYFLDDQSKFGFTKKEIDEFEIIDEEGQPEKREENSYSKDQIEFYLDPSKKYDLRKFILSKCKKKSNGELQLPDKTILVNKKLDLYYK